MNNAATMNLNSIVTECVIICLSVDSDVGSLHTESLQIDTSTLSVKLGLYD